MIHLRFFNASMSTISAALSLAHISSSFPSSQSLSSLNSSLCFHLHSTSLSHPFHKVFQQTTVRRSARKKINPPLTSFPRVSTDRHDCILASPIHLISYLIYRFCLQERVPSKKLFNWRKQIIEVWRYGPMLRIHNRTIDAFTPFPLRSIGVCARIK